MNLEICKIVSAEKALLGRAFSATALILQPQWLIISTLPAKANR